MADYNARIAARIQSERKKLGLSHTELAAEVGAVDRTVRRWERGESEPQPENLRALAKTFGIKVTDIRPSTEAEEQAVLAQLDRIEKMLRTLLRDAGLKAPAKPRGRELPEEPPPLDKPQPKQQAAPSKRTRQAKPRRRSG